MIERLRKGKLQVNRRQRFGYMEFLQLLSGYVSDPQLLTGYGINPPKTA